MTRAPEDERVPRVAARLSRSAYEALKEDIAARGLQDPIRIDEHGDIIDGWHRHQICRDLDIECEREVVEGLHSVQDKMRWILEANAHRLGLGDRKHASQARKRTAAYMYAFTSLSTAAVAELFEVDRSTISRWTRVFGLESTETVGRDGVRRTNYERSGVRLPPVAETPFYRVISAELSDLVGRVDDNSYNMVFLDSSGSYSAHDRESTTGWSTPNLVYRIAEDALKDGGHLVIVAEPGDLSTWLEQQSAELTYRGISQFQLEGARWTPSAMSGDTRPILWFTRGTPAELPSWPPEDADHGRRHGHPGSVYQEGMMTTFCNPGDRLLHLCASNLGVMMLGPELGVDVTATVEGDVADTITNIDEYFYCSVLDSLYESILAETEDPICALLAILEDKPPVPDLIADRVHPAGSAVTEHVKRILTQKFYWEHITSLAEELRLELGPDVDTAVKAIEESSDRVYDVIPDYGEGGQLRQVDVAKDIFVRLGRRAGRELRADQYSEYLQNPLRIDV